MAGFVFNEQKFVNDNIFKYEDRLNSQYSRFLDKSPTYVTYFNINNIESTVDLGFSNIEEIIGPNSPLKFKEIKDFPVYGIDSVQFDLEDDEEGLNISYDSELIILPNTIKPTPNDFFILNHLGKDFLFMVTSVAYDTIKSNNYYKIGYSIKSLDGNSTEKVKKQVTEVYNCVVENIGTEDKCLIKAEEYELLKQLWIVTNHISDRYLMYFYNEKYNSFIYNHESGFKVYDRYLTFFIKKHNLFNDRNAFKTIMLSSEDESHDFFPEYDSSIYKFIELRKPKYIKPCYFVCTCIHDPFSTFSFYRDRRVKSVRFRHGNICYLHEPFTIAMRDGVYKEETTPDEPEYTPPAGEGDVAEDKFIRAVRNRCMNPNTKPSLPPMEEEPIDPEFSVNHHVCPTEMSEMDNVIIRFLHDKIDSVYNIDLDELDNMIYFDYSWDVFIKIPLLLYVLKFYQKQFLRN